jgi:hypothetical protein
VRRGGLTNTGNVMATVEATRTREVGPNKTGARGSSTTYRIIG